jgi:hypothetical protein
MTNNIMALADAYANDRIELSKCMSASLKSERTLDACGWVDDSRAALQAEVDRVVKDNKHLRDALKNLLQDTQHAEHEDCEDGPCPVREARAALGETK